MRRSMKAAALYLLVASAAAWGQSTTATILGTLRDSTGALMPGVNVTATNTDTNFSRRAQSDATGRYMIQFLPVGTYRLEVEAAGFKRFVQSGILLEVDRNARIDPVLEVGAVTESLQVTADAPLVDTTKVALGQTVSNSEILNLPLVGRDVYALLNVIAGVQNNEASNAFGPPGEQVSVYGSSNAGTGGVNFTLDGGMSVQSLRNTGNPLPNPDALQEFRVTTHLFDAEYGRFGGGVVNVITKSGTNSYHGIAVRVPPQRCAERARVEHLAEGEGAAQPVRRQLRRTHQEGPAVLLRQLRRLARPAGGDQEQRARSHRARAPGRFFRIVLHRPGPLDTGALPRQSHSRQPVRSHRQEHPRQVRPHGQPAELVL